MIANLIQSDSNKRNYDVYLDNKHIGVIVKQRSVCSATLFNYGCLGYFETIIAAKNEILKKEGASSKRNRSKLPSINPSVKREYQPVSTKLIGRILERTNWAEINTVLVPAAGDGTLAMCYKRMYRRIKRPYFFYKNFEIDVTEQDPSLQAYLADNGHRLIHDDFLTISEYKKYDLILMHPPKSSAIDYLEKALQMQQHGGKIICIIESNIINEYIRQSLEKLSAAYIILSAQDLGLRGQNAVIQIDIPGNYGMVSQTHKFRKLHDLPIYEYINSIIDKYNRDAHKGTKFIEEYRTISPYFTDEYKNEIFYLDTEPNSHGLKVENEFIRFERRIYWRALFGYKLGDCDFYSNLYGSLYSRVYDFISMLEDYDLTYFNIKRFVPDLKEKMDETLKSMVLKSFDRLSHMTKFIGYQDRQGLKLEYGKTATICKYSHSDLDDLDIILNYLSGSSRQRHIRRNEFDNNKDLEYDNFYVNKTKSKATIKFKSKQLLERFNIFAAREKGWLPPRYGALYDEMKPEGQAIIDNFQGRDAYDRIRNKPEYFLSPIHIPIPILYEEV